ncbi:hypothetical protein GCM10022295_26970 [Streptomyces osmaniensis]|uniref:Uncharacterized protein n=1 Tax=Streptomyces osmaniensis TaxID=593134 RepID=A0ABP6W2Z7_9ACTN
MAHLHLCPEAGVADAAGGASAREPLLIPVPVKPLQGTTVRDPAREEDPLCCPECPPVGEFYPAECTTVREQSGHRRPSITSTPRASRQFRRRWE